MDFRKAFGWLPGFGRGFRGARGWRARLGRRGELLAAELLSVKGCGILARNYRNHRGEIDIVARDGLVICFVEVKTRRAGSRSAPASNLSESQKSRIRRAAAGYLREIGRPAVPHRFDLVEVVLDGWMLESIRHWPGHPMGAKTKNT